MHFPSRILYSIPAGAVDWKPAQENQGNGNVLEYLTTGVLPELVHALIAGLAAIRYLWPVWLLIAALWLLTRGMRAVGRFLGFSSPTAKPTKPAVRPRR